MTISPLGLAGVILFSFFAGWLCSRIRMLGKFNISFQRQSDAESPPKFVFEKTIRTLSVKCQCGETWEFHETSGRADQSSQPMPAGESFSCPKCGRTIDLREFRKLQNDARLTS